MTSTAPLRCKCRKQAETGLRCSRCFVPICPDCSRPAPVGMLCRACARGTPSRLYQVDPKSFALAIPVTLAAAVFGGWLMATIGRIGFFAAFAGFIYGMAVGEIALRIAGRKRGVQMEIMAGACVFLGMLAGQAIHILTAVSAVPAAYSPNALPITGSMLVLRLLMDPWIYVSVAVAVFGAVSRIRSLG